MFTVIDNCTTQNFWSFVVSAIRWNPECHLCAVHSTPFLASGHFLPLPFHPPISVVPGLESRPHVFKAARLPLNSICPHHIPCPRNKENPHCWDQPLRVVFGTLWSKPGCGARVPHSAMLWWYCRLRSSASFPWQQMRACFPVPRQQVHPRDVFV